MGIGGFSDLGSSLLFKRIQLVGELLQGDCGAHKSGAEGD